MGDFPNTELSHVWLGDLCDEWFGSGFRWNFSNYVLDVVLGGKSLNWQASIGNNPNEQFNFELNLQTKLETREDMLRLLKALGHTKGTEQ